MRFKRIHYRIINKDLQKLMKMKMMEMINIIIMMVSKIKSLGIRKGRKKEIKAEKTNLIDIRD